MELSQVPFLKFSQKHIELLGSFGYGQNEVYPKTTGVFDAFSLQSLEVTGGPAHNLAFYLDWRSRTLKAKKRWGLYHQNGAMLWGYVYAMFTGFVVGWNVAQLETLDLDGFSHLVQWFSHCKLQLRRSNRLLPSNALSLDQNMCLWMQGKHDVLCIDIKFIDFAGLFLKVNSVNYLAMTCYHLSHPITIIKWWFTFLRCPYHSPIGFPGIFPERKLTSGKWKGAD